MGPVKPVALATHEKYIVTFTCDFSRYAMAYALKDKTQVHTALLAFLKHIRCIKGPDTKISEIRTDGGTEYHTKHMKGLLVNENISLSLAEPATPQHNAVSERLNLELQSKMRVNLLSAKMPNYYWKFAMNHTIEIHNRTPNVANRCISPYEIVNGSPPDLSYVRRFGCEAYVLFNDCKARSKFSPKARKAFLLECNSTGYTLVQAHDKVIIRSKHVEFVEFLEIILALKHTYLLTRNLMLVRMK